MLLQLHLLRQYSLLLQVEHQMRTAVKLEMLFAEHLPHHT
jgi:hypothetical protein